VTKTSKNSNKYIHHESHVSILVYSKKYGDFIVEIDKEDFDRIKSFAWSVSIESGNPYFYTTIGYHYTGFKSSMSLHRYITSFEHELVDHSDGNTLNNRKNNLRSASHSQNMMNTRAKKKKSNNPFSEWKGVYVDSRRRKFYSRINKGNGCDIYLGSFDKAVDAARAYNEAASTYHGSFARLNDLDLYRESA
jgi:hypothetical protein